MKTVKTIKTTLSLSLTLAILVAICYAAFAQARYGDLELTAKIPQFPCHSGAQVVHLAQEPLDDESDPKVLELRDGFLEHFLGLGSVSPATHTKAVAAARALPVSPLVGNWTFQALSPLWNQNGGSPCTTPFPQSTFCGASARIDAIAVDPTNADIVYVGSNGGLFKSVDGGQQQWSYLSGSLPSQLIKSITFDPVAHNIIYVGTGTAGNAVVPSYGVGVYRSTDSGATWKTGFGSSQFSGKTVGKMTIDPQSAGSATSTTLYASVTDGSSNHTIWKSTNSGTTWSATPIRGPTPNAGSFYDIVVVSGQLFSTIYATAPDGLFKSTNGGTNWSASIHPRGIPPNRSAAGCLAFVNGVLYIAFTESGQVTVSKSTNGGTNWTDLTPAPAGLSCFGVDPSNPNRMFIGDASTVALRYSLDGGSSWIVISGGNMHADVRSMAFCPTNPPNVDRIYLGNDAGLYRADYNGVDPSITWYTKNENLPSALMNGISISSDDHLAIGTQDNGTQIGWAGQNPPWTQIWAGDGSKPKIDQTNSSKVYWVYYESDDQHDLCSIVPPDGRPRIGPCSAAPALWVNGGQTNVTPTGAYCELSWWYPGMFVTPTDSARVIIGFQNVWRSTNSGTAWTRIGGRDCSVDPNNCGIDPDPIKLTVNALCEAPSDTNVIFAVTAVPSISNGKHVFVTTNANQDNPSWTDRTSSLPSNPGIRAVTIRPGAPAPAPQTAYLATNVGLYKTTDTGVSWTRVGFANMVCYDVVIDPAYPEHLFVATTSGVYVSMDGGATWGSTLGIPLGMAVTSLSLNATSRHLAASTYGRGAYILDLSQ